VYWQIEIRELEEDRIEFVLSNTDTSVNRRQATRA
jgi:hypothetical protein